MKSYSVAIVGLSELFRAGLQALLKRSRCDVVCNTSSLDAVLAACPDPSQLMLVYALGTGEDAIPRIREIGTRRGELSGVRIALLAGPLTAEELGEAAAAGIDAVLSKDITNEVLQRSLDLVMLGQQLFPAQPAPPSTPAAKPAVDAGPLPRSDTAEPCLDDRTGKLIKAPGWNGFGASASLERNTSLSDREQQILRCLVAGAANKMIARDLCITEATVKVHIKGLLRKIRVTNRTQAAVWGLNNIVDGWAPSHPGG